MSDKINKIVAPPLGLIPREFHEEKVSSDRFNDVCQAISRYYNAGLHIDLKWIEEYNEIIEKLKK